MPVDRRQPTIWKGARKKKSGNPEQLRLKRGRMAYRSRRQERITDLLAVGLLANHRQMISHLCCKRSSMGSFATATTCTAYNKWLDTVGIDHRIGKDDQRLTVTFACYVGPLVSGTGVQKNNRNPNSVYKNHVKFQKSASIATSCHEGRPFSRQKFLSIVSQQRFGRPTRPGRMPF